MSADQMLPVVVGALIALAGTVFVQLFIVPRLETRRRHDERWEQAVLALGQMLTLDHPHSTQALRSALSATWNAMHPPEAEVLTTNQWASRLADPPDELITALESAQDSLLRFRWLAGQVVSRPSDTEQMQQLRHHTAQQIRLHSALLQVAMRVIVARLALKARCTLADRADAPEVPNIVIDNRSLFDDIDEAHERLRENTQHIVPLLEEMAASEPPRRLRRWRGRRQAPTRR